jgi:hypothetical protein
MHVGERIGGLPQTAPARIRTKTKAGGGHQRKRYVHIHAREVAVLPEKSP